ncbi:MAG: hypothetical protein QXF12_07940 [Candidatus Aenigmatarchaeota archaeon]
MKTNLINSVIKNKIKDKELNEADRYFYTALLTSVYKNVDIKNNIEEILNSLDPKSDTFMSDLYKAIKEIIKIHVDKNSDNLIEITKRLGEFYLQCIIKYEVNKEPNENILEDFRTFVLSQVK